MILFWRLITQNKPAEKNNPTKRDKLTRPKIIFILCIFVFSSSPILQFLEDWSLSNLSVKFWQLPGKCWLLLFNFDRNSKVNL